MAQQMGPFPNKRRWWQLRLKVNPTQPSSPPNQVTVTASLPKGKVAEVPNNSSNMPFASKVDVDHILDNFIEKKSEMFNKEMKLLKNHKSTFWRDLIKRFDFQNVHLKVKENRRDISRKLNPNIYYDLYNLQKVNKDIGEPKSSRESIRDTENNKQTLNIKTELSYEEWNFICDSDNCANGDYHTLETHEWSSIIQKYFNTYIKHPCFLSCTNADVCPNDMIYLKINGKCVTCLSDFQALVVDKIIPNSIVTIDFIFHGDYENCKGLAETKIIENKREELKTKLKNKNQFAMNVLENNRLKCNVVNEKELIRFCKLLLTFIIPALRLDNIEVIHSVTICMFEDLGIIATSRINLPNCIDKFLFIILMPISSSIKIKETSIFIQIFKNYFYYLLHQEKNKTTNEQNNGSKYIYIFKSYDESKDETKDEIKDAKKICYLEDDPNEQTITDSMVIGILKNGNLLKKPISMMDGYEYTLRNTCAFDTLVHLTCSSFIDSMKYSAFIDEEKTYEFFGLVSNASRHGINDLTYRKRVAISVDVYCKLDCWTDISRHRTEIDCTCTLDFMIGKVFADYPSLLTTEICPNCAHTKTTKTVKISVHTKKLNSLNDDLLSMSSQSPGTCRNCEIGNIEQTNVYGKHIFIEPYWVNREQESYDNLNISVMLRDIPKTIMVQQQLYYLRGMISFIPPLLYGNVHSVGHYVAYCWRNATSKWEEYDDLSTSPRTVTPCAITPDCQIILYTI